MALVRIVVGVSTKASVSFNALLSVVTALWKGCRSQSWFRVHPSHQRRLSSARLGSGSCCLQSAAHASLLSETGAGPVL